MTSHIPFRDGIAAYLSGAYRSTDPSNDGRFALAAIGAHRDAHGIQLLSKLGGKGGSINSHIYLAHAGCPTGQGRMVQVSRYYDTDGRYVGSDWVYLTDCTDLTELATRLARIQ